MMQHARVTAYVIAVPLSHPSLGRISSHGRAVHTHHTHRIQSRIRAHASCTRTKHHRLAEVLKKDDVVVTNSNDKTVQLLKLLGLSQEVGKVLNSTAFDMERAEETGIGC